MHQETFGVCCKHAADYCLWISKDPSRWDGGANFYGYAYSEPVNHIDVTGNYSLAIGGGVAVAAGGAAVGAVALDCLFNHCKGVKAVWRLLTEPLKPKEEACDAPPQAMASSWGPECNQVRSDCVDECIDELGKGADLQSFPFTNCLKQCEQAAGCYR
jgi:hypothetical protein